MKKLFGIFSLAVGFSLMTAAPSSAQVHLGPQLSLADDADLGIGGRIVAGVPQYAGVEFAGSFDVFFPDGDVDYWEVNANLIYNFEIREASVFRPYAGGGINIATADSPGRDSETDLGLNVLGGAKFPNEGPVTPFVELRGEIEGGEQFVLTAGVLFP